MTTNERFLKLATATPEQWAQVELPGGTERITLASVLALIGKAG